MAVICSIAAFRLPGSEIDLGPHLEDIRLAIIIDILRIREIHHLDVVGHETDGRRGIPVQTNGEVFLLAARDAGVIQIDAAEAGPEFPGAYAALADDAFRLDAVKGSRAGLVGTRFPRDKPAAVGIPAAERRIGSRR